METQAQSSQQCRTNVTSCAGQNTKLVLHVRPTQNHLHKGTAGLTSTGQQVQHKSGAVHGAKVACEEAPDWNMQHEQQSPSQSRLQWLVSTQHEQPPTCYASYCHPATCHTHSWCIRSFRTPDRPCCCPAASLAAVPPGHSQAQHPAPCCCCLWLPLLLLPALAHS